MTIYNLKTLHHGEQSVYRELLKVAPLIEKHFKPANNMKAAIQSGRSAAFGKVCQEFREDCAKISNARIYVDDSRGMSAWLNIDVNEKPAGESSDYQGCCYFKHSSYIGDIDSHSWQTPPTNEFTYKFNLEECEHMCKRILKTSQKRLATTKLRIDKLKAKISELESSVPYQFKGYVNNGR